MEKKYKCETCSSVSNENTETCCNSVRKEINNKDSKISTSKCNVKYIYPGAKAGVIAGVVFGVMMAMSGSLPKIASLFGSQSVVVGFIGHLVLSAIIGALFGLLFGHKALTKGKGIILGLLWGFIWWILGPVLIMPIWLGIGIDLSAKGIAMTFGSIPGHLIFGFIMGLVYVLITDKKVK